MVDNSEKLSSALQSLAYHKRERHPEESKAGWILYNSNAADWYSWDSKVDLKLDCVKTDSREYGQAILELVVSLRGDAYAIAQRIDHSEFADPASNGVMEISEKMQEDVFPEMKKEIEAIKKVLEAQGMDPEEIEKHIGKNY